MNTTPNTGGSYGGQMPDWYLQQVQAQRQAYVDHLNDPNAARNYLFADASRRQPYADNLKATFDHADAHWQDDPQSNYNLASTYGEELREVLNAGDWDTIDPAFKKVLEDNIARSDKLKSTILAAHPELAPPEVPTRPE